MNIAYFHYIILLLLLIAEKYCSIVIAEGGLRIMTELMKIHTILNHNNEPGVIHSLAQSVINQCLMYMKNTAVEESSQLNQ